MLVIQVFIMRNGAFEGTEMVTGDRIEIGRDPTCALQLDDDSLSRQHCAIFEHDGKLAIQDLGSANGTRVNGEAVHGARYIGPRDDIALGAYTLKLKIMSGQKPAAAPPPVRVDEPTRVTSGSQSGSGGPQPIALAPQGRVDERTLVVPTSEQAQPTVVSPFPVHRQQDLRAQQDLANRDTRPGGVPSGRGVSLGLPDVGPTEVARPGGGMSAHAHPPIRAHDVGEPTLPSSHTQPAPPPVPPISEDGPAAPARGRAGASAGANAARADVTVPESAKLPAFQLTSDHGEDALPDLPAGADVPTLAFAPQFLEDELHEPEDEDPPWSLVQRLVRPTTEKNKSPLVEVVHYRGEVLVDHTVLREGDTFKLGATMTRAERRERGLDGTIPLVRLKKGGVAEIFMKGDVTGKLLRGGQQQDLAAAPGVKGQSAVPITDGELASLKVQNERVFIRFAGAPQLLWTREDAAEDLFARKLTGISLGSSVMLFSLMAVASWIYQYRNADQEVIALEDEGFAEVELKELKTEEPPPEEKPVEPIQAEEPTPQPDQPKTQAPKEDNTPKPVEPTPKPGVMDILNNIPQVKDSASSQNLTAALSNIKGVRVPGATSGFKTSSLVGKGPSSGVQIGGAAGGLSTSGINSVLRKDGAAGAMGGKGDRAVSGKVTTMARQLTKQGQGELSKEEVMRVINANIGKIQYCYEKALRTQPGLSGRVVLEWTVNTSGKVTVVKVAQSSLASNDATRCMMDSLKGWKFPQPKGGNVSIVFPFVFNTV